MKLARGRAAAGAVQFPISLRMIMIQSYWCGQLSKQELEGDLNLA